MDLLGDKNLPQIMNSRCSLRVLLWGCQVTLKQTRCEMFLSSTGNWIPANQHLASSEVPQDAAERSGFPEELPFLECRWENSCSGESPRALCPSSWIPPELLLHLQPEQKASVAACLPVLIFSCPFLTFWECFEIPSRSVLRTSLCRNLSSGW